MILFFIDNVTYFITDEPVQGTSGTSPIKGAFANTKKRMSREEVYAEMAAADLIPINRLAKSRQIRLGLQARQYNPLKTPRHVMKDIDKFARYVKLQNKQRLARHIKDGLRYTFLIFMHIYLRI